MKYFAPLKLKDILSLIGLVIIGFTWIMIDQIIFKQSSQRFIVFTVLMILLFQLQFWINKPKKIWRYANTLSFILVLFVIISSLVMHLVIYNDIADKKYHSILIWIITGILPYFTSLVYLITKRR
jgi:FlaA1/EpsC-like NDP-sugar epimerase